MLRNMSYRQFQEWIIFHDLEPFGEEREDWRLAHMVQAVVNTLTNIFNLFVKHPRPARSMEDCMPVFGDYRAPGKPQQTSEQIESLLDAWITGSNASLEGK